jgi:hypothetical protein
MAPSALFVFVKRDMLLLDILIVQDAFKPSGCNFQSLRRPAPKRIRRNFVPGGYSALHLFFEVRHGLKSDFTNDLYRVAYEFFIFEIGTGLWTIHDYP